MKKFKNYAFWVVLAGAIVVFLENLESMLCVDIDEALIESLILSFCGILVVLGIVTKSDEDTQTINLPDNGDVVDEADSIDNSIVSIEESEQYDENKANSQSNNSDDKDKK